MRWVERFAVGTAMAGILSACGSSPPPSEPPTDSGEGVFAPGNSSAAPAPVPPKSAPPATEAPSPTSSLCKTLASKPRVCEDFDDGSPPADSDTLVGPGGEVGIDTSRAKSSPNSYRIRSAPSDGAFTDALLRIPVDGPAEPKRFLVGFDFRPDAEAPTTGVLVIGRAFLSAEHQITIELASNDGPVVREIDEGGLDKSVKLPVALAETWTRYELDFDLAQNTLHVRAGGPSIDFALDGGGRGLYAANLGITADLATSWTANYDDVVLDLQ